MQSALRGFANTFHTHDDSRALPWPAGRATSESFSTAAKGGYKEARLDVVGPARGMMQWYYRLGAWHRVFAPSGRKVWEGIVWRLDFSSGVSYDLTDVFNAVLVEYSTSDAVGLPGSTGWLTDAASIARLGRKELVHKTQQVTLSAAQRLRALLLYFHLHSMATEQFAVPTSPVGKEIELSLTSYGWYYTLGFERWVNYSTGAADTGSQIRSICAASTYVTTTATTCPNTGFSIDQERSTENLTGQAEVERLAALGDSAGYGLWFQVWEGRIGYLTRYGGGDFPAVDYYADQLGLYDKNGALIPTYLGRADRVLKTNRFLPGGYGILADPLDTPASVYLLETEYRVGKGLFVKPAGWKDFASLIVGV